MSRQNLYILVGAVAGLITLLIAALLWFFLALRPVDPSQNQVTTIRFVAGERTESLAQELKNKGLIRNATVFSLYTTITNQRRKLQAGSYDVLPSQSTPGIIKMIAGGEIAANRLLFTEGSTTFALKELLRERGLSTDEVQQAFVAQYQNEVLKQRPTGASLEGYLFPDTYQLTKPVTGTAVLQQMLDNFERKLAATDYRQRYAAQGLSLHQAVTLASIVDREVRSEQDQAMVAQLYLNRLGRDMMLQADPTAIYGAELAGKPTKPVDVTIDSPYNTYKIKGLPPGPIGNPGLTALKAVAYPKANDYLYFISGKDGTTHFARTYDEHKRNIEQYLN